MRTSDATMSRQRACHGRRIRQVPESSASSRGLFVQLRTKFLVGQRPIKIGDGAG